MFLFANFILKGIKYLIYNKLTKQKNNTVYIFPDKILKPHEKMDHIFGTHRVLNYNNYK